LCVYEWLALATTHDILQNKETWNALFRPSDFFHKYRQEIYVVLAVLLD